MGFCQQLVARGKATNVVEGAAVRLEARWMERHRHSVSAIGGQGSDVNRGGPGATPRRPSSQSAWWESWRPLHSLR